MAITNNVRSQGESVRTKIWVLSQLNFQITVNLMRKLTGRKARFQVEIAKVFLTELL